MDHNQILNTVVQDKGFEKAYDKLLPSNPWLDEWLFGVDFLLSREPEHEDSVHICDEFRLIVTPQSWGIPSVRVIYRYSDDDRQKQEICLFMLEII